MRLVVPTCLLSAIGLISVIGCAVSQSRTVDVSNAEAEPTRVLGEHGAMATTSPASVGHVQQAGYDVQPLAADEVSRADLTETDGNETDWNEIESSSLERAHGDPSAALAAEQPAVTQPTVTHAVQMAVPNSDVSNSAVFNPAVSDSAAFDETTTSTALMSDDLNNLLRTALDQNPRLLRLYREYQAAASRSQHIDKLPDPKLGANVFGNPIETASGSQRANMNFSQAIPWLSRLSALQQQACFEAWAVRAEYAAERLRVVAGIRTGWYRLSVIDKQIDTTLANQELLESLVDVANARIATGAASQGDVLLGTLELSKLEERLLLYRQQRRGVEAEINRLIGRPAEIPIVSAEEIPTSMIELDIAAIQAIALQSQPEIDAARLRTQASRWGIEVARLSRRPEFMLSASYFLTDNNRPLTPVVEVGEDPWALGVQASLPIWRQKYDALRNEAEWKHQAAHSSVTDVANRYEALIIDLVTEAQRAAETATLYKSTILPQAEQTLLADQASYANGDVEFDRVIRDYRNLLTLELGYQQAVGELAIANARIQQAAGQDLAASRSEIDSAPLR